MTEFGAAASSSSSSFTYRWPYHVFLSFRGEDTRQGFTGHLYNALDKRGIRTFIDDQGIRKGEEITPTLLKTIEESKTAIVVFSKDYASSTFCLRELVHILDCMKGRNGRFIWPVFYDVDPSDIRHQKGSYKVAFDQYEGVKDETTVKRWRSALTEAASISGCHFDLSSKSYEYEIIEEIIEAVSKEISIAPLYVAHFPVGLESRVEEVCSLLYKNPHPDGATMVGIFGLGGIGKMTIARALYNEIASNFKQLCFLDNVKEKRIHELQKRLLSETVRGKNIELEDYSRGIPIIKDMLHNKKVLLILDDIDTLDQLKALAGKPNWFGTGSIIIITTRDKSLLEQHEVERIYEAKELNDEEAHDLLIGNAFRKEAADPKYKEVIIRAIKYARGLPLALEILGSSLGTAESIRVLKTSLDMYEKIPNKTVQKILEVSYDGLEEMHKQIFLDIACFHRGWLLGEATNILSASHSIDSESCIRVLKDKSLIKIDHRGCLDMHDLIQDMGKEIVRLESPSEAGERSRLWSREDIFHVLEENTGTATIQAINILLNFYRKELERSGESFEKMKNLKVLRVLSRYNVLTFSQGLKCLPNSLRVVEWDYYPSSTLPDDFCPVNLVILRLSYSHLKTLGKAFKNFNNLRQLDLSLSKDLQELPDMSEAVNLEVLDVSFCQKLTKIDDSVGRLANLEVLNLRYCSKLHTFPEILVPMKNIKTVDMRNTAIKTLPESIGKLDALERLSSNSANSNQPGLKTIYLADCVQLQQIRKIPPNIKVFSLENFKCLTSSSTRALLKQNFFNLLKLSLRGCENLEELPDLSEAMNLEELNISYCKKLTEINDSVGRLSKLRVLNAKACYRLDTFIVGGFKMVSIEILNLKKCSNLHTFPEILENIKGFKTLDLSHTVIKTLPESIEKLIALEALYLNSCKKLRQLPNLACPNLKTLELDGCKELEEIKGILPNIEVFSVRNCTSLISCSIRPLMIQKFFNLRKLNIQGSENLEELPDLSEAMNLEELNISYCKKVTKIDDSVGRLGKLKVLNAEACYRLDTFIVGGIKMVSIEILNLNKCSNLCTFPEILENSKRIKTLDLSHTAIKTLPKSIEKFIALEELYLNNCKELRQLPNLACHNLKKLILDGCKELEEIRGIPPNIEEFYARNCISLTFRSTRLLFIQELQVTRTTEFILPGNEIPKWLHKHSTGGSVSFWVREKFPQIALCAVVTGVHPFFSPLVMHINGVPTYIVRPDLFEIIELDIDHIILFDLRHFGMMVTSELLAKEWNHVKFSLKDRGTKSRLKCIGVYVYNYDSCREDIVFENPIHQERIQVEAVHKIGDSNLVSSSRDNNEEDLQQQRQQHLTSIFVSKIKKALKLSKRRKERIQ